MSGSMGERALERALCQGDFYYFLEYMWPAISLDEFKTNWHIPYICQELQSMAERVAEWKPRQHDLIVNVPPGTTKTTIVSIAFPAWCWTRWFWMRFITASYSSPLSLESAEYSRDLIKSDRFRDLFPELEIKKDKDQKGNFRIQKHQYDDQGNYQGLQPGGNRYSTSVGGTLTGFHGHINLVDDPVDPRSANTEAGIRAANFWLDNTLPTRKVDKAVTPTIMIMQRLHQDDPTGHWLEKKKRKLKHICLPGEIRTRRYRQQVRPLERMEDYTEGLLDVNRMDWEVLEDMKADLGQFGFAGQVGQTPIPAEGGMFKVDRLAMIEAPPAPVNFVRIVRYWDKAGTEDGGAYTAGVKMAKLKNGKYLILDVVRGQWSSEVREMKIKSTAEADGYNVAVVVEQEPGSGGKESAEGTIRNLAGFNAYRDAVKGDKVRRADPFSVQVNNGNVQILHGDWNKDFKNEMEYFPNSTYKDQVDAASGAFARLTKKKQVKVHR
jgi:predicted phage terminase large subunit-like protein